MVSEKPATPTSRLEYVRKVRNFVQDYTTLYLKNTVYTHRHQDLTPHTLTLLSTRVHGTVLRNTIFIKLTAAMNSHPTL